MALDGSPKNLYRQLVTRGVDPEKVTRGDGKPLVEIVAEELAEEVRDVPPAENHNGAEA